MAKKLITQISQKLLNFDTFISKANLEKKPHQRVGVKWMLERELSTNPLEGVRGGLVADEMGLGKTIQVIGLMVSNFLSRTLVVLPLALLDQWKSQIYNFTGHDPVIYHGVQKKDLNIQELIKAPIVLTTYGHCVSHENKGNSVLHKIPWDRVVFDEAHHLRNPNTRTHVGASLLKSPIKWLVTGTPIQNRKSDFYALCKIMGYSKDFYMETENLLKIAKWSLLKRTKQEVGIQLPKVNEENIDVVWKNKDEECLAEDIHGLLSFASVRTERQTNAVVAALGSSVLPTLVRCRQTCVYPSLMKSSLKQLDNAGLLDSEEYDLEKATSSSSKLDAVCEKIVERKDNKRAKLVFCHYRGEIDEIKERLEKEKLNVAIFDGRTAYKDRQLILQDESLDVLILQIMTGCEGLNLQHFKEIYFVSPHWNPAIEDQAVARCHRIGQQEEVDIFRFSMDSFSGNENSCSLDSYASDIQDAKRSMYSIMDNPQLQEKKDS